MNRDYSKKITAYSRVIGPFVCTPKRLSQLHKESIGDIRPSLGAAIPNLLPSQKLVFLGP